MATPCAVQVGEGERQSVPPHYIYLIPIFRHISGHNIHCVLIAHNDYLSPDCRKTSMHLH